MYFLFIVQPDIKQNTDHRDAVTSWTSIWYKFMSKGVVKVSLEINITQF